MKTVYMNVSNETVGVVVDQIKNKSKDSIICLAPATSVSVHSPSNSGKYKEYHRVKLEVLIPKSAIKGDSALFDLGITTLLRLPKNRVEDEFLK